MLKELKNAPKISIHLDPIIEEIYRNKERVSIPKGLAATEQLLDLIMYMIKTPIDDVERLEKVYKSAVKLHAAAVLFLGVATNNLACRITLHSIGMNVKCAETDFINNVITYLRVNSPPAEDN